MSRISLDPVYHLDRYTDAVQKELDAYLKDILLDPLEDILETHRVRMNEEKHSSLWNALMLGIIWYADGVFTGEFNAVISRELRAMGAKKVPAGFAMERGEIPLPLRAAINQSTQRATELHQALINTLTTISVYALQAPTGIPITKNIDIIIGELQDDFAKTVADSDKLPPAQKFPQGEKDRMAAMAEIAIAEAIRQYISHLAEDIRAKVRENLLDGARIDKLQKLVEAQRGVAQRKIRYIAENQVAAVVADFREVTARNLGSGYYIWITQHDERVRDDHRVLDSQVFSWDNPPVTNRSTGERHHPGGDRNCRCVARPILNIA